MMIQPTDPDWLKTALMELGVTEIVGPAHSPRVLEYHATTTLRATTDEVPWCSSFVNWAIEAVGKTGTRSAASLSWLQWGEDLARPRRGAVCVFTRFGTDGRPLPGRGHVGFWVGESMSPGGERLIQVLGGNQSNAVSLMTIPANRLLGMRWPKTLANSTTVKAAGTAATGGLLAAAPGLVVAVREVSQAASVTHESVSSALAGLALSPMMLTVATGLVLVVGAVICIVKERAKKITTLGI